MQGYKFLDLEKCPMCESPIDQTHYFGKRLDRPQGLRPDKSVGTELSINKCPCCQLVYPAPIPVRTDEGLYAMPLAASFWENRDQVHQAHFEYELRVLSKLVNKPLNTLLALDIGFGLGSSLFTMVSNFKEVHGIEPFKSLYDRTVETYRDRIDGRLLKHISFEESDYEKEKFDFIFFEALQHIPDLDAALKKAFSWLKPGGILYVEVPSSSYLFHSLINLIYRFRRTRFVVNTNPMHGNLSYYEFSVKSFVESGKRNGFKVIYRQVFVCTPPLKGILKRLLILVMKFTGTGMQRSIWLQKA